MADNLGHTPGTGATLRTLDIGGIHYPAGTLFDAAGNALASATGIPGGGDRGLVTRLAGVQTQYGNVRVSPEPVSLLSEVFDAIDTTTRWFPPTTAGGYSNQASGASVVNGEFTFTAVNTNGAWAALVSRATFGPIFPAFTQTTHGVKLEVPASGVLKANVIRHWGFFSAPATPTSATPITDGYGFETTATGELRASVYTNGTRTQSTVLTAPTDGGFHRYTVQARSDRVFFFLDDANAPVAWFAWPALYVQMLPVRLQHITTAAVTGAVFNVYGIGVGDTGGNVQQIGDATNPARRAVVNGVGALAVMDGPGQNTTGTARFNTTLSLYRVAGNAATDTIQTAVIKTVNGVAAAGAQSITATAGRVLRLTNMSVIVRNSTAVFQGVEAFLRMVPSGTVVATSPLVAAVGANAVVATAGGVGGMTTTFGDTGIEISGTQAVGISFATTTAAAQVSITLNGYEYVI